VARLILLVQHPYHLSTEEAAEWLRTQAEEYSRTSGVRRVRVSRLSSLSLQFGREWDWMFELELEGEGAPGREVRTEIAAGLLGDLRVLGMRSSVALVEPAAWLEGPR